MLKYGVAVRVLCALLPVLGGCSSAPAGDDASDHERAAHQAAPLAASDAATPTLITFSSGSAPIASGPILAGQAVKVAYDPSRLVSQCGGSASSPGGGGGFAWGITGSYSVGGAAPSSFQVTITADWASGNAVFTPSSAGDLQVWFGCSNTTGDTGWDSDFGKNYDFAVGPSPVSLVYAGAFVSTCAGCSPPLGSFKGFVEVQNLAYQKDVEVVYSVDGGNTFQKNPASFWKVIDSQREIWSFDLPTLTTASTSDGGTTLTVVPASSVVFALSYTVAGKTYWDHNGGKNYPIAVDPSSGALTAAPLGFGRNVALTSAAIPVLFDPKALDLTMFVRNLAPQKDVEVVYTTDGWATTQRAAAQFQKSLGDVEQWTVSAPLSGVNVNNDGLNTNIQIAVAATQAGGTQWDNNFGENFSCSTCESRSCQEWLCLAPTLSNGFP